MLTPTSSLPLSPREQEILLLAADGLIDTEICNRLGITRSTISTYWVRLREKLGAASRSEAIAKALGIAYTESLEQIRQSQLWMQLFVEAAEDYAIFSCDPSGIITSWNPGVLRLFGYMEEDFVGKPMEILFTPTDLEIHAAERERELAIENGRSIDNRWHVRKDGVRIWCGGSLFALRDEHGQLKWFAKIVKDETEEWQMRRELDAFKGSDPAHTLGIQASVK